ncbi:MAG TPA: glucosyltransferase domain-containing protein [Rudaea sp.]|nr:glucosyltransferase domain-containing protein [Rudaea sp.]
MNGVRPPLREAPAAAGAWWRPELGYLLAIFAVCYFFRFSTFTLSIDDEFGALRDSPDVWMIQGRWGIYLLERFVVSQQVLPFFPLFVFGCCVCFSYPQLLAAFGVPRLRFVHYAAFPLYAAFPIWTFALSFLSNTLGFGLGLLAAACAVARFASLAVGVSQTMRPGTKRSPARDFAAACGFGAMALGLYQSFLFWIAALGLAVIVVHAIHEDAPWRRTLTRCIVLGAVVIGAIVVYEGVEIGMLHALGLGRERYVGNFLNLPALLHDPVHVLALAALNAAYVYGGGIHAFGAPAYAYGLVVLAGLAAVATWPGVAASRRCLAALLCVAVLALPFTLHVAAGGDLPGRTLLAAPAIMAVFALLGMTSPRPRLAKFASAMAAVAVLQTLYVDNLLQTANEFARKHDEALAAALYARIVEVDRGVDAAHPPMIDVWGGEPFDSVYPRPLPGTAGYSFFEWDGGNIYRIVNYMHLLGYPLFRIPSLPERHRNDAAFAAMPVWPNPDSVRAANGMVLIKLGAAPGFR